MAAKDWTQNLPRPSFRSDDGDVSEGVHGRNPQAGIYPPPVRWPLFVEEAGQTVWREGYYWRRVKSRRVAVEVVTKGNMQLRQNGRDFLVEPGQAMLLHRGSDHIYATGPAGFVHKRYVTLVGPALDMIVSLCGLDRIDVVNPVNPSALIAMFKNAFRLLKSKPAGYESALSAAAYGVVNELAAASTARRSDLVQKIIDLLQTNPHRAISNRVLADETGVSPGYLLRQFRMEVGRTPLAYHLDMRLSLARRLVQATTLPVKEIAAQVGFDDPLYFSKVFKRLTGKSPRAYRL